MKTIAPNPSLNSAQLFVLQTLATADTEQDKEELTSLCLNYIQQKLDAETSKWWKENNMTNEKLEEMCSNIHYRTPYITK